MADAGSGRFGLWARFSLSGILMSSESGMDKIMVREVAVWSSTHDSPVDLLSFLGVIKRFPFGQFWSITISLLLYGINFPFSN